MCAAKIPDRSRTKPEAVSSNGFAIGVLVSVAVLCAVWWLWPPLAATAGLIVLLACGWQIWALGRRVRELANRDPLTRVASRACFLDAVDRAVREFRTDAPVSLAVIDCDDFKRINERFGHLVGDAILIQIANVLTETIPSSGIVGRMWGDAFAILLAGLTPQSARDVLREAQQRFESRMAKNGWPATFTVGVSSLGGTIASADDLLSSADAQMFNVKRRGHNGAVSSRLPEESIAAAELRRSAPAPSEDNRPEPVCLPDPEFARQA